MNFDLSNLSTELRLIPDLTATVQRIGFDAFWQGETTGDPFLPLALAAEHTTTLTVGTSIALAFTRSPTVLAHLSHELARQSQGRFVLGLGTQVRAHIERRFGMAWAQPVERMRAVIDGIRAVWNTWQTGTPLKYRSPFYRLDFMPPFFCPAPHAFGDVPIYLAAVNTHMLRLAGESADGCFIHPLHTVEYLDRVALPALADGHARASNSYKRFVKASTVFVVPTDDPDYARQAESNARQQIAFYLSTPAYRVITEIHRWGDLQAQLSRLARSGRWSEMGAALSDSVVDTLVVRGTWSQLPHLLHAKYAGRLDRVSYYLPFVPGEDEANWRISAEGFRSLRTS